MAVRGWGGPIAVAIGGAAGTGAAQLGLGYGLGIIAWLPASNGASDEAWKAGLAWATWIAATSTIAGAILAGRYGGERIPSAMGARGAGPLALGLWRIVLAVAAAVGALVTVVLVAVPARAAVRADAFSPQSIAAGYAVLGVVVGLLVAVAALTARAIAANLIATSAWLWVLAIAAVVNGVAAGRGVPSAQLGVWHFTATDGGYFRHLYLPGAALTLGAALAIGALGAAQAARRADNRVGVAVSGAMGPLLVAASYFLAAPGLVAPVAEQLSAYLVAPYAVIAGLAGSVLASALPPTTVRPGPRPAEDGSGREDGADEASTRFGRPADGHLPARPYEIDEEAPSAGSDPFADPNLEPAPARASAAVPSPRSEGQTGLWARLGRRRGGDGPG
jgi:hypothetical protein